MSNLGGMYDNSLFTALMNMHAQGRAQQLQASQTHAQQVHDIGESLMGAVREYHAIKSKTHQDELAALKMQLEGYGKAGLAAPDISGVTDTQGHAVAEGAYLIGKAEHDEKQAARNFQNMQFKQQADYQDAQITQHSLDAADRRAAALAENKDRDLARGQQAAVAQKNRAHESAMLDKRLGAAKDIAANKAAAQVNKLPHIIEHRITKHTDLGDAHESASEEAANVAETFSDLTAQLKHGKVTNQDIKNYAELTAAMSNNIVTGKVNVLSPQESTRMNNLLNNINFHLVNSPQQVFRLGGDDEKLMKKFIDQFIVLAKQKKGMADDAFGRAAKVVDDYKNNRLPYAPYAVPAGSADDDTGEVTP